MIPHLNLLFLPSRCSSSSSQVQVQVRTLLIRFQVREFSSSPFLPPPPSKRVGEDEYKVRVSVLWDFNTCRVPSEVSYLKVAPSIMGAVRTNGFKGPIQIEAYGNVYQLSDINQETLFLNGIDLHHIPGGKNNSHRYLKDWISINPPPAHLFLISGDKDPDFVRTVRHLSLNNYNILFAFPGRADDYLCSASTITLQWSSIVEGKYLIGKDFKLDNDTDRFEDVHPEILDKKTTSQNPSSCKDYAENKHENPSRKEVDEICRSPYSSPTTYHYHLRQSPASSISVPIPIMFRKNLFFLTSRFSFSSSSQLRRPLIPFSVRDFSCSSSSPTQPHCKRVEEGNIRVSPPLPQWKRITEDEYNLRVLVCWDFETCGVPSRVCYSKVAPSITGALRTKGFKGPIHIEAYGNVYQLSEINQEILFSTGVDLHHIPGGRTDSRRFLVDWISQKPRRAHLLLISGDKDRDLVLTVSRLTTNNNYSILFAYPESGNPAICYASTITWRWSDILEGKFLENLVYLDDDF